MDTNGLQVQKMELISFLAIDKAKNLKVLSIITVHLKLII